MATDILSPVDTLTNLRSRLAAAEPSHTEQAQVRYPLTLRVLDYLMTVADTTQRPTEWGRALAAAEVLLGIEADDETLAAMLIVGTLPRKDWDIPWLTDTFGVDMAGLVGGVLRVGRIDNVSAGSDAGPGVETLRKMLLALADDVRVVLILLADRVTYLRSITRADEAVRRAAAQLTRDLYAPLANRLGVFAIKWELEDFAFRYLQPDLYKRIATLLDGKRGEREAYIQRLVALLKSELTKAGIQGEIAGRPKHIWSIHRKMQSKNLPFERLYDVRAVRVLVESVADCYAVLALVHALWTPIEGEFDDYIAQPKANNYRSLHTAVRGPEGKTLEVQIRTHEMHQTSENGVAAHWRYKEGGGHKTSADRKFEAKIAWLRQVLAWRHELVDQGGFSAEVKQNLFDDTLYVFTPQGKVIDLPAGATPVDFAYRLHTDLGHRCRGAKVDGQIVPLNTPLKNAERVEILAAKQGGPSRDWLNPQLGFLASSRAQAKVRAWFRQEYFEVDVAHGRQTLERELARAGVSSMALEKVAEALRYKTLDDCLADIGRGEITPHQIEGALRELSAIKPEAAPVAAFGPMSTVPQAAKPSGGVLVLGLNNIATLVAKCCKPMPGDAILGFVTKSRGVMVHRADCPNVTGLQGGQRERLMAAAWGNTAGQRFAADIEVMAVDRQGLLRDVTEALSHERINVTAVNSSSRNNVALMRFTLDILQPDQLQRALRSVGEVAGVERVQRV